MDTDIVKSVAQLGPWGAIAVLAIVYAIREHWAGKKNEEDDNQLKPILAKLEHIEDDIKQILVDNKDKVSFEWIEKELAKYRQKDVTDVIFDNIKESLKRAHERIDHLEKESGS